MSNIGEIVTQADLASIQAENNKSLSQRAYVAPTVFRLANKNILRWNYYNTKEDAFSKLLFLNGSGGKNVAPAGAVDFTTEIKAQTMGVNVDFYLRSPMGWMTIPYGSLKNLPGTTWNMIVYRFYTPKGSGPYYGILSGSYFGTSAISIENVPANKIAALDEFHRQLQLLKIKYNVLASYLEGLSKRQLNEVEQQSFNEGLLMLTNLKEQLKNINGADFTYSYNGQVSVSGIGVIPIIVYIIAAVVFAAAAAWSIDRITTEANKTARINASYDMQKWIADQKYKIAQAIKAGTITPQQGNQQINELQQANQAAQDLAKTAAAPTPGVLDNLKDLALIGLVGLGLVVFSKKGKK